MDHWTHLLRWICVSEVVPAKSRADGPLHQAEEHVMSDVLSGLVTRRLSLAL